MMVEGCRYVGWVATVPEFQHRGYAEAVMRHALEIAARVHADTPTTVHASDAGRPLYARMGYSTIATHTLFIENRLLTDP